jgi:hypothetical protein
MLYNSTLIKKTEIKIKIFEPLSNRHWLEEKVNAWLKENNVEVIQINMAYSDDKYILTMLYKECHE